MTRKRKDIPQIGRKLGYYPNIWNLLVSDTFQKKSEDFGILAKANLEVDDIRRPILEIAYMTTFILENAYMQLWKNAKKSEKRDFLMKF